MALATVFRTELVKKIYEAKNEAKNLRPHRAGRELQIRSGPQILANPSKS